MSEDSIKCSNRWRLRSRRLLLEIVQSRCGSRGENSKFFPVVTQCLFLRQVVSPISYYDDPIDYETGRATFVRRRGCAPHRHRRRRYIFAIIALFLRESPLRAKRKTRRHDAYRQERILTS